MSPTFAVLAGRAKWLQLVGFWVFTLVGNLLGGFVVMWMVAHSYLDLAGVLTGMGLTYAHTSPDVHSIVFSITAGVTITLMPRMQMGTDNDRAKIMAAIGSGLLLFGTGILHAILDVLLMFGAWHDGAAITAGEIVVFLAWVVPSNVLGGLLFVTATRAVQSEDRVRTERAAVATEKDSSSDLADDARGERLHGDQQLRA